MGRGRSGRTAGGGGAGGGSGSVTIYNSGSMISARERQRNEVDQALGVMRSVQDTFGVNINDAQVVDLSKKDAGVMAYYDSNENLAINKRYFDAQKMDAVYDDCVTRGFHPSRGSKTGIEATVAHELGHRLTDVVGVNMGFGKWGIDQASDRILSEASRRMRGKSTSAIQSAISGYAKQNNAECIAEAFSDVWCNGRNAKRESRAVVGVLRKYLRRK